MTGKTGKVWRKSPAALVALFDQVLPRDARIERRQMFGYPCAFVGGQLFTGLHQDDVIVRLSEADRAVAIAEHGAAPFEPMPGRSMRAYVVLPPAILADPASTAAWLLRALEYAAALPPKTKKPAKKAAPKKPTRADR